MSEFDIISEYFKQLTPQRPEVVLGIGDDCALVELPQGKQLAVTTDTLNVGIHFPERTDADDIGYKSLAVNLSDLAAMGAEPAWASLNLSLPASDTDWLRGFSQGFAELAREYNVQLIGGDTTRGPLSITVQLMGWVEPHQCLRRDAARPGDLIYVSGTLGDAALGIKALLGEAKDVPEHCIQRLLRPRPRVELGQALSSCSRCAIDISDGLIADLGHILERSQCGARIELERIPLSPAFSGFYGADIPWTDVLSFGDDYEL